MDNGFTGGQNGSIIGCMNADNLDKLIERGAVSGALNRYGQQEEMQRHADMFYESIRNRTSNSDVVRIAKNTGFSESDVLSVKQHIFINEHDLDVGCVRFHPDYDIAVSWANLIQGG